MIEDTPKVLKINKKDKLKRRLKNELNKMVDNYTDDPSNLEEMDALARRLAKLYKINNKDPETEDRTQDRFKNCMIEIENEEKNVATKNFRCILNDFENILEIADNTQIEETVEERIDEIRSKLRENDVVIVQGNTGCGKTTRIPRMLMDEYNKIICTQPRRLAAINVARKVANDIKCDLGSEIGYAVRFEKMAKNDTKLIFATDGILIKEIQSKNKKNIEKIAGYDLIIIDEAHERTVNIDFLLGYLKPMLQNKNVKTKLLIMSATLNAERFVDYFNCPLITIHHKSHDMEYFYLKNDCEDYVSSCVLITQSIIQKESEGDILVFLTGQEEIERAHFMLSATILDRNVQILKLFSTMPAEEQDLIFANSCRKIILSTNIAETSITIENVKYVVDSGKFKAKYYSTDDCVDSLNIFDISKAQAKQRAGRAGRTQPGVIFRTYSYDKYMEMMENPIPEILRSKLHSIVLSMKSLGIIDIEGFDFIDSPSSECIKQAELYLFYIRAIDMNGIATDFGKKLANIPLDPETSVSLFAAKRIGCLNAVATISAFLEYPTPFVAIKPESPDYQRFKSVVSSFSHPKGSFYSFLTIFHYWEKSKFSIKFLKERFLNIKVMTQILNVRTQILRLFPESNDTNMNIEKAFCAGFFMKSAKISENSYKTIFGNVECYIHPKDGLYKENPKYLIYYDIFSRKKEYMGHCIEVSLADIQLSINQYFHHKKA